MKINFENKLFDENGNIIGTNKTCVVVNEKKEFVKENGNYLLANVPTPNEELTLKDAICKALLNSDNKEVTIEERYKKWKLYQKIFSCEKSVNVTAEEITEIKKAVNFAFANNILIFGQICDILEKLK